MIKSEAYLRLARLRGANRRDPDSIKTGDIWGWRDGDLNWIILVLGHSRRRRHGPGHTFIHLYHWGEPSLRAAPQDLRDDDGNALSAEQFLSGERAKYLCNIFDVLPLRALMGGLCE